MNEQQQQASDNACVMLAFSQGELVDSRRIPDMGDAKADWRTDDNPTWNWECIQYRVQPKKVVQYINVYPSSSTNWAIAYATRAEADAHASETREGCNRVELSEGQFDD